MLIQHSETLKREYRILLLDYPEGFVEMNTDDAKQLGIRDGENDPALGRQRAQPWPTARVTPEVQERHRSSCPTSCARCSSRFGARRRDGVQLVPVRVAKEAA